MAIAERSIALIDARKYPFTVDGREFVLRRYGVPPALILEKRPQLLDMVKARLLSAVRSGVVGVSYESLEQEVLTFYYAAVAAYSSGSRWLVSRLALAEAERAYKFLLGESEQVLEALARMAGFSSLEYLGLERAYKLPVALVNQTPVYKVYQFRARFVEYVKVARRLLGDPAWSPAALPVAQGYVYLERERVARLVKEALTSFLEARIAELGSEADERTAELLRPLVDEVASQVQRRAASSTPSYGPTPFSEEALPPCISDLVARVRRGENLSHPERFALATFMINAGADLDYIVDLFRNVPDFDEKKTRYQVEHLAGLRGSRKKYLTYSCEKMKTLGICRADCGTKTPLQEYRRRLMKLRRGRGRRDKPS
jgi:DNA primase large subunit